MAIRTVTDALQPNQEGWLVYTPHKNDTAKLCEMVAVKCDWEARMEGLQAVGVTLLTVGKCALLGGAAYVLGNIFAYITGIVLLPLIFIPPLYKLIILAVGIGSGGLFAKHTIPKIWNDSMVSAKAHWNYGTHLDNQAATARIHQAAKA